MGAEESLAASRLKRRLSFRRIGFQLVMRQSSSAVSAVDNLNTVGTTELHYYGGDHRATLTSVHEGGLDRKPSAGQQY